jgi:NAD-dependent SIR2 family protein deacetylase
MPDAVSVALDEAIATALRSIAAQRLVIFTGAGLSMAAPSSLPSAKTLAQRCTAKHHEQTGETFPDDIKDDIGAIARRFDLTHELESYFLQTLVDWSTFNRRTNPGHRAIADFLLSGAIELSVTGNFDTLVETAAESLGELDFLAVRDGIEASQAREHQTLLKIHGCYKRERRETLWCVEQLVREPLKSRIDSSMQWLSGQLMNKDFVFVGYWTDRDYLKDVLVAAVSHLTPMSVLIVDPEDSDKLKQKAPQLWTWAESASQGVSHLQVSGSDFLNSLRSRYSQLFLKKVFENGRQQCSTVAQGKPVGAIDLAAFDVDQLYEMRRRVTGALPSRPVRSRREDSSMSLPASLMLRLVGLGGVFNGPDIDLNGRSIRVLSTPSIPISQARAEIGELSFPQDGELLTVCAGAFDDGGVPSNLVREGTTSSVVRPSASGEYITYEGAVAQFGL